MNKTQVVVDAPTSETRDKKVAKTPIYNTIKGNIQCLLIIS